MRPYFERKRYTRIYSSLKTVKKMKQYIKSFALLLLTSLGFVACNEPDLGTLTTYPDKGAIGNWKSEYASGDYDYIASLSLNVEGDTICSLQQINKETGIATNFIGGTTSYDPKTGMTTVNFATTGERNVSGLLYIAYRQNKTDMNVQFFKVSARGTKSIQNSFVANPITGFEVNHCQFNEAGKDEDEAFIVLFGCSSDDNLFTYAHGEEMGEGKFTWDYNTGEGSATAVNIDDNTTHSFTLSINANNQLVVTENGNSYTMERVEE